MALHPSERVSLPSVRTMSKGVQAFIAFSLAGAILAMWWKKPAGLITSLVHLQWQTAALLLPLLAVDYALGGLRYRIFFDGKILARVSLWDCMRSNWANIFLGAVTPFQTGGGPAQLYVLWRAGARVSDSMLISLINFVATLLFFMISTVAAALLLPDNLFGSHFLPLLRTAFVVVAGIVVFVLALLLFPALGLATVKLFFRVVPVRSPAFCAFRDRQMARLEEGAQHLRHAFRLIMQQRKWSLVAAFLLTILLFANKYVMGYTIARAFGQHVDFGLFVGLQIVQLFLIYFAPTPGASGMAELSAVWLMARILPEQLLLVYAVLWRLVTTIAGAIIGGVVLLMDMRRLASVAPVEADPTPSQPTESR